MSSRRRAVVWTLVVLASLIGVFTILTTWLNRQLLDNNSWRKTSTELIQDPKIQSALSVYLVNQLYDNVDVAGQLEQKLPKNLKPLAAPLTAALREPATTATRLVLTSQRVQQLWVESSSLAHAKLVNVLENHTGAGISTGNGAVTLDLSALVKELGAELGVPVSALDKLPENTGVVTVVRSSQLSLAQTGVRLIRVLSVWLVVLVLGMYLLAVYLARGARRETLRSIGWAISLVGLVVIVVQRFGESYAVSFVSPVYRAAGHRVWLIGTSILGQLGWSLILYGLVCVLGTVLAGPTPAATAVRRTIAPVLNNRPGLTWGTAAATYLLVVFWGGTHALRAPWGILILGALFAAGVEALRRQTLREFPTASGAGMAATAHALRDRVATSMPHRHPAPHPSSPSDEIIRLRDLHDAGVLSDEEFVLGKKRALTTAPGQ